MEEKYLSKDAFLDLTFGSTINLTAEEKNNLGFYLAMYVALMKMGRTNYRPQDIVGIDLDSLTPKFLSYCLQQVIDVFQQLRKVSSRQLDVLSKSRESTNALLRHFESTLNNQYTNEADSSVNALSHGPADLEKLI